MVFAVVVKVVEEMGGERETDRGERERDRVMSERETKWSLKVYFLVVDQYFSAAHFFLLLKIMN